MQNRERFFDFAAQVGLAKHLGGLRATEDLAALWLCGSAWGVA